MKLKAILKQPQKITAKLNKTIIHEYPLLQEKSITPSEQVQEIVPDESIYGLSKVTVRAVDLQELTGDATATEKDILEGKIAYVNGEKITGTMEKHDGTYKITDTSYLFYQGTRANVITDVLKLCSDITNTSYMFENCEDLTELDVSSLDTTKVTNMAHMFSKCSNLTELDVSNFDTTQVTNMSYMFANCSNLTELDVSSFDTKQVTNMSYMFSACLRLTELNLSNFDTSQVTNMSYMFGSCNNLTELNLSSFDISKVSNITYMFSNCKALTNLNSFKNLGKGYTRASNNYSNYKLTLSSSTNLTHDSLIDILIDGLYDLNLTYDVANGGTLYTQSLTLGSTNLAKLTAEEIAIATAKGWTVS